MPRVDVWKLVAGQIARNLAMAVPAVAHWRARRGRTAVQPHLDPAQFLDRFAYDPFDVLRAGIAPRELSGLSLVELGPGDHVPLALLALAGGARCYTAIDRFPGDISGDLAGDLYRRLLGDLAARNPKMARAFVERGLTPENFLEARRGLVRVIRAPIEAVAEPVQADVVFSYNVLEHIVDVPGFARSLYRMLAPGGVSVHRVDFGPHDVWAARQNPLEWLTLPDWLWFVMGSNRGTPNRWRHAELVDALDDAGLETTSEVVDVFDTDLVERTKEHLAPRFRQMSTDSLRVRAAILRAQKRTR